jgi:hypothetical protein
VGAKYAPTPLRGMAFVLATKGLCQPLQISKASKSRSPSQACFLFSFLSLFLNHTAFKLHSLWHVGYLLDDLYDFNMCSRVGLLPCNPARRLTVPPSPVRHSFWGSVPSYWFSRVATTTGPHPLFSPSFHYPSRATGWTPPWMGAYAVLSMLFSPEVLQPRLKMSARIDFFAVRPSDPSAEGGRGMCL